MAALNIRNLDDEEEEKRGRGIGIKEKEEMGIWGACENWEYGR